MRYVTNMKANAAVWLGVALVLVGCSGNQSPKLSPIGQAATEGRAVMKAADAVVSGIDTAMTNQQLPAAVGRQVLLAVRQVGVQGQTLADALAVANAAKDASEKQKGIDAARAALSAVQATLLGAISPIKDEATKNQVAGLLKQLTDSLLKVQTLIDLAGGGGDLVPPVEQARRLQFNARTIAWAVPA